MNQPPSDSTPPSHSSPPPEAQDEESTSHLAQRSEHAVNTAVDQTQPLDVDEIFINLDVDEDDHQQSQKEIDSDQQNQSELTGLDQTGHFQEEKKS